MSAYFETAIETAVIYAPITGAVAGAIAGAGVEALAVRRLSRENEPVAGELGEVVKDDDQEGRLSRVVRYARASLIGAGALTGMANAPLWMPAQQDAPPFVGLVVDHSAPTALGGKNSPITFIDKLAETFDSSAFDARAYVAVNSQIKPMEPSKVKNNRPFGDALLPATVDVALLEADTHEEAGLFVISNGNSIGSVQETVAKAKAADIPVFIADVEGKSPEVKAEFQQIAKETGGEYWGVNAKNVDEMIEKVEDTLEENNLKDKETANPWTLRIFGAVLGAAAMTAVYSNRRREPIRKKIKG